MKTQHVQVDMDLDLYHNGKLLVEQVEVTLDIDVELTDEGEIDDFVIDEVHTPGGATVNNADAILWDMIINSTNIPKVDAEIRELIHDELGEVV